MASDSSFHVSICGGGIGGLALALVIEKYGTLPVEIFEAGPTIATVGAGIGLYARIMEIMEELGLYDEIVKTALEPPQENDGPKFRNSDQQDGYHWFTRRLKRGLALVHRKDLIDALLRHIPDSCKIHTSKRLEFYDVNSETGKITLHFSDGSSSITDVLVGADGIRSATRKTMYRNLASLVEDDESKQKFLDCTEPVWTGILAYRNLIPAEKLLKENPDVKVPLGLTFYLGKLKHVVTYPISQGRLINVVFHTHKPDAFGTQYEGHWVTDVSDDEIVDQFEDWEVLIRALMKCVDKPSKWALHSLRPLPQFVDGNVILLGDAAHAMHPHLGAGAGQAIEDAFVLGRLLTHELTHRGNVGNALKIYEQVRLPFVNGIVQLARDVSRYFSFQQVSGDGSIHDHNSPEALDYVRKALEEAWQWRIESSRSWDEAKERWHAECNR